MEQSERDVRSLYEAHARSCNPKDFQSQVMRTPHGKPVGQDQIALIIEGMGRGLDIAPDDVVLDLCCGNGAITDLIFARCRGGVGVDFTSYLIEVAKTNFERPPDRVYRLADVQEYVETTDDTERFTKVMCYGAFQCLWNRSRLAYCSLSVDASQMCNAYFWGICPISTGPRFFGARMSGRSRGLSQI